MDIDGLWDQPRIAAEFRVSVVTVREVWRNGCLHAVRNHLGAAGLDEQALGVPVQRLTRKGWEQVRRDLGLRPLRLHRRALPLPDMVIGNSPVWSRDAVWRWAAETGRVAEDGTLWSPVGRPTTARLAAAAAGRVGTVSARRAGIER